MQKNYINIDEAIAGNVNSLSIHRFWSVTQDLGGVFTERKIQLEEPKACILTALSIINGTYAGSNKKIIANLKPTGIKWGKLNSILDLMFVSVKDNAVRWTKYNSIHCLAQVYSLPDEKINQELIDAIGNKSLGEQSGANSVPKNNARMNDINTVIASITGIKGEAPAAAPVKVKPGQSIKTPISAQVSQKKIDKKTLEQLVGTARA